MRLEGIHHVTAITGDAQLNVDFYVGVLGLRMIKKTVNHDAPEVYHLYYGDERGSPGSAMTFFEFPGAQRGRAGAGMVHRIGFRIADGAALDFWAARLQDAGCAVERDASALRFSDPEGLGLELVVSGAPDAPLAAHADDVPAAHALRGFAGARAYASDPGESTALLTATLGFRAEEGERAFTAAGAERRAAWAYDPAPPQRGLSGAGTVHHIAWASHDEHHEAWQARIAQAGRRPTEVIDRIYFRSIYFREPSGVLFEIATLSPGFTADEPLEQLGETLVLPARYEPLREQLERSLTPISNPRSANVRS